MKIKKILSLLLVVCYLSVSTVAFADAVRINPKKEVTIKSRRQPNDIVYEDFTTVEEGSLPTTVVSTSANGYSTSGVHIVDGENKKNCLEVIDTTPTDARTGPTATFVFSKLTGEVGFEMRYKFIPTGESQHTSLYIEGRDSQNNTLARVYIPQTGITAFNYGGVGQKNLESKAHTPENWYVVQFYFNLDAQTVDCRLINEGAGTSNMVTGIPYFKETNTNELSKIIFNPQMYDGTYVIDYFRLSRETHGLAGDVTTFPKGCEKTYTTTPANKAVSGKTNIKVDGVYKYTTISPIVTEKNNVLVSVKNLSSMFGLYYSKKYDEIILKNANVKLTFTDNGKSVTSENKIVELSDECRIVNNQLMVPIQDVMKEFGYSVSYDSETNEVLVLSATESENAQ